LWLGYLAFGLAFTMHISTHLYYSLPIVPIVALSAAPASAYAVERLRIASPAVKAVALASCCALVAGAALKVEERLRDPTYRDDVRVYEQVGVAAGHTAAGVDVDPSYSTPLLYYAWVGSSPLYSPYGQMLQPGDIERSLHTIARESGRPRLLIVTAIHELDYQPELRAFVRRLPVVRRDTGFVIFRLRRAAA
jgi:hypothetical protein